MFYPTGRKEIHSALEEHFLKTGRGRRAALPLIRPTNSILLHLYCLKEDHSISWETVTDWYIKLFGPEDVTRGKLEHKVKSLLKTLPSTELLESNVKWSSLPDDR
ncbi:hypothetical protein ElyMa_005633100 [Elysia marginata]|uniref:Mos1 transposase HTH domain-containing protein n=1 Tax=Elysia marginata TaxID=1093978 RepID=A0AAV4FAQ5_9GAST|nr:hypothetical protein ElyMa_005633100 [Elysia marginata]